MRLQTESRPTVAILFLALLLPLWAAAPVAAQVSRLGSSFSVPLLAPASVRFEGVAYDSINNVYLAITGAVTIRGRFIRPDGTFVGDSFRIDSFTGPTLYAQCPSIAFNPMTGTFLVAWSDGRGGGAYPDLYGRVVAFSAGGVPAFISSDTMFSSAGGFSWWEARPGIAYSTTSRQFLVTWRQLSDAEIHGRMVNDAGAPVSGDIQITQDTFGEDLPAVSYNPATDQFLVGYSGWAPDYNFSEARWVQAGANAGPVGTPMRIVNSRQGVWAGDAAYNSVTGKSFFFYASYAAPLGIYAQRFNRDGSFDGGQFAVSTHYYAYDAMSVAYNPVSNTFALVTHSSTAENAVVELHQDGTPVDNGIIATTIGGTGNFNPQIASHQTSAQWLLVTSNQFNTMFGQFVQTAAREPGGPPGPVGVSVTKSSPANGTGGLAIPVTLSWAAVPGATGYQVCVDTINNDACDNGWTSVGMNLSASVSNLSAGTTYYWQLQATVNGSGISADSGTWWGFTVVWGVDPQTIDLSAAAAPNGSWVFAEGALGLGPGFSTFYAIANENDGPAHVRAWFVREGTGAVTFYETTVPARTRQTLDLSTMVGGAAGSYAAVFQSVPSAAEGIPSGRQVYVGRSVYWGGTGGVLTGPGHLKTGAFVAPGGSLSTQWYFAEGTRVTTPAGPFQTYYLFFNPTQTAANITVEFLSDDGTGLITTVNQTVAKQSRWTLSTDQYPQLSYRNFSARVIASAGIMAERSMYWGPNWSAGHTGFAGSIPSLDWYFAEGTAMTGFDTYYLLLNPTSSTVTVNATYQLSPANGVPQAPVARSYSLLPNSRKTVYLPGEVGYQTGVASEFHASAAVVVERSMYWGTSWTEGSTVLGATAPATEWHLPEGSTMNGFETFLLLSNPNTTDAMVAITTFSSTGEPETYAVTVFARTRLTVYMNNQTPAANAPVWTTIQGKAFSVRVGASGTPLPIVAEEAVYWKQLGAGQYWRGGDATLGFPVIK